MCNDKKLYLYMENASVCELDVCNSSSPDF